jgi:hypothetical protein
MKKTVASVVPIRPAEDGSPENPPPTAAALVAPPNTSESSARERRANRVLPLSTIAYEAGAQVAVAVRPIGGHRRYTELLPRTRELFYRKLQRYVNRLCEEFDLEQPAVETMSREYLEWRWRCRAEANNPAAAKRAA